MVSSRAAHWALIICLFFAALAPMLTWIEFSGGMEDFNLATAVESRRDHQWLIPTLYGRPRLAKPPMVHWITAWSLGTSDSRPFAARWPSLLAGCFMLVAIYELGRAIDDWPLGLTAALICGTTLMFLKFAWQASYDIHLALWVMVANVGLARAVVCKQRWGGCALAGTALGFALMCKGPVAILQVVGPLLVVVPAAPWFRRRSKIVGEASNEKTSWLGPSIMLGVIALGLALPWPIYAARQSGWTVADWFNEVALAREKAVEKSSPWYSYLTQFFPMFMPWVIWLVVGLIDVFRSPEKLALRMRIVAGWIVVPMLVMSFFPKQRDRYLLPLWGPTALIAAYALHRHLPVWKSGNRTQRTLVRLHQLILISLTLVFPIWGAVSIHLPVPEGIKLTTADGGPWYSDRAVAIILICGLAAWALAVWFRQRLRMGLVAGTVALMVVFNLAFMYGYSATHSGQSDGKRFAAAILSKFPDAIIYNARAGRQELPLELLIYLDRDVTALPPPASIHPRSQAQVAIYPKNADPSDAPLPPEFVPLSSMKINDGIFQAFVLPAKAVSAK